MSAMPPDAAGDGLLWERSLCPVCGLDRSSTLIEAGFDEPPIRGLLAASYPGMPDSAPDLLAAEGRYVLRRCDRCGLTYQLMAPTDRLAFEVYERWIDADVSRASSLGRESDDELALQILEAAATLGRPAAIYGS